MWVIPWFSARELLSKPIVQVTLACMTLWCVRLWFKAGPDDHVGVLVMYAWPGAIVLARWSWRSYRFGSRVVRFVRAKLAK